MTDLPHAMPADRENQFVPESRSAAARAALIEASIIYAADGVASTFARRVAPVLPSLAGQIDGPIYTLRSAAEQMVAGQAAGEDWRVRGAALHLKYALAEMFRPIWARSAGKHGGVPGVADLGGEDAKG